MATRGKRSNLLALAVLATLIERPMHRYEMASVMRSRGKEQDMSIKLSSLYTVVQSLETQGLVEAVGTSREGTRPERTVYRITDAGTREFMDWTRELLAEPRSESTRFVAGLSVLGGLPPAEVTAALQTRLERLAETIAGRQKALAGYPPQLPRLFLLEEEFAIAMLRAEQEWVEALVDELESKTFPDLEQWQTWHEGGAMSAELTALAEGGVGPQTP